MKNLSRKGIVGIVIGIIAVVIAVTVIATMALRVDTEEAKAKALEVSNGGEIVSQEISGAGLWNEYSFRITNGDQWYDIEIGGFGNVKEMETGSGQPPLD